MPITDSERVIITRRLAQAEEAYHNLQTGKSARVLVDQNSERIEFVAATASRLYTYILELRRQLGLAGSTPIGPMRPFL